ncbi:MAG TPA: diguanylate cyclase [Nitrospiria bacterium]|nr:diguanylate cyclase [Nitrospiria bacterium]
MPKIFLIGAGKGGKAVLSRLLRFDWLEIAGVADVDPNAPGIALARESGVPIFTGDSFQTIAQLKPDLVFDLTGKQDIQARLRALPDRSFEIVSGQVSHMIWSVIHELERQEMKLREFLGEHRTLSEINLMLSRSETPEQIFEAIVTGGLRISAMPAGSLSIYNKEKKELYLVSAKGFSLRFYQDHSVYPIRPGGLTETILSQHEPVIVPDIADYPAFNNPVLLDEGIRSLIALPLLSEKGPVGILYTDDFKPRTFHNSVVEALKLLGSQAVLAIQKQQTFEKIKSLSIRDPLTGLYNRHYLNGIMVSEMERAYSLRQQLSIILIDIDHFKSINDRFGHLIGDQVLHRLSQLFSLVVRPYDTLARFGGEEFLVLMAETGEDEAMAIAERLRAAAANERLLPDNLAITCSFGVATLDHHEPHLPTSDELIGRADKALYEAKRSGRNRVHLFRADRASSGPRVG